MSVADMLDEQSTQLREDAAGHQREIERLEEQLVNLRYRRDDALTAAAEMVVAANALREIGLRAEMTAKGPFVAVDYFPKKPDAETASGEGTTEEGAGR